MRLIPGKTKVKIELFRGVSISDIVVGLITLGLVALVLLSTIPGKLYVAGSVVGVGVLLLLRLDSRSNYLILLDLLRYIALPKKYGRMFSDKHLLSRAEESKRGEHWDEFFSDKYEPEDELSLSERIERIKERKAQKKQEEEILGSKDITDDEKNAVWRQREEAEASSKKNKETSKDNAYNEKDMEDIMPFTGISEGFIEYNGKYYGTVIEIDPVEFRFFSSYRRNMSIESCFGKVLRSLRENYAANIVKIDRPIIYDKYLDREYDKLDALRASYEQGMLNEEELKSRVEIQYDRINALRDICYDNVIIQPFYYFCIFNINKRQLLIDTNSAISALEQGELTVRRLKTDKELAVFLKYSNDIDFDEREIDRLDPADYVKWAMPERLAFNSRTVSINQLVSHQMRVVNYPSTVGDSWLAGVMSIPSTKVVVKVTPMERTKSIRSIDRSLQELRVQYSNTGIDSKRIELENHIQTLSSLLVTLQQDNELLLSVNIYITMYDAIRTSEIGRDETAKNSIRPVIADMKKTVRRSWQEAGMRLNQMDFAQVEAFIGSQISGYDPFFSDGRGMPTNTVAGMFPWIYARVSDEGGIWLGNNDGVPVFIDFFRRDSERVNSNMVIIGKSGSGKSYGTKALLTNMASEDSKIFILDPENEYTELAHNLHGKVIDVGNAKLGRLNPFHVITTLDDDEAGDDYSVGFAAHLQFLEEFFRQILPDVDRDALEYLNSLVERLYMNFGITMETDLSNLGPQDYPIFDDLYDLVLEEFQRTGNDYLRSMLQMLMNYVSKFATGGRNANIWNGPSSITTDENFSVFNFQSLLANRNTTVANAQMLLVLKYIDNEIIKNRDYNKKYGLNRKIIVVIDEAHVFIDTKFPIALDFMFQLAKRIRKYNGMQIVITQNIKDFVGSEEIARKSTAIINACQYSFIFGLAPNDMDDLCRLYEKAGGINDMERDQIITAPRGMAFTVMGPTSRSSFKVSVQKSMVRMFEQPQYNSQYFVGEDGAQNWEDFIGNSREIREINVKRHKAEESMTTSAVNTVSSGLTFEEISPDEADLLAGSSEEFFNELQPGAEDKGVTIEEVAPPAQPVYRQPVQTAPSEPVDMEAILAAVRAEVVREMSERAAPVQPAATVAEPSYNRPSYEEPEDEEPDDEDELDLNELDDEEPEYEEPDYEDDEEDEDDDDYEVPEYDDDDEDDEDELSYDDDDDEDEEDSSEGFSPKFDIMALLDEQLSSYSEMSLEERMEEIDVETMEISLEELMEYVKDLHKRRRA